MNFRNSKQKQKLEHTSQFETQRCFDDYFKMDYLDKNSQYWEEELIQIPDYDKKISYLIKLEDSLGKHFEENELRQLADDLVNFVSKADHIRYFDGDFHNHHAHIHYDIGTSYKHYDIGEPHYYSDYTTDNDNEINFEQQDIDTD